MSSHLAEARARHALRASRLPHRGTIQRASSTRNEIYLTERHVVRVNSQLNHRLYREAQLYDHLPDDSWAPKMVAAGGSVGADYLIVERKPGGPLAHVWPELDTVHRRQAIAEIATCLRAIHRTPTPGEVPHLHTTLHLLDGNATPPFRPLVEGVEKLAADPNADRGIIDMLRQYVAANAQHLDCFPQAQLIHGDMTFENVLWDGRRISAVVDFEWCRGAPPDLELDVLFRLCAYPAAHVAQAHETRTHAFDYADIPLWLAEDYPELFSHPNLLERLTIYALAYDLLDALAAPIPACRRDAGDLHPYNRLVHLMSTGGHVAEILARMGLRV